MISQLATQFLHSIQKKVQFSPPPSPPSPPPPPPLSTKQKKLKNELFYPTALSKAIERYQALKGTGGERVVTGDKALVFFNNFDDIFFNC